MKPEDIKLSDWARIFMGEAPALFYLEIVIRVFFIYLLLMVSMRLLGKRMSTHISRLELATMTALASAIGVPILSPSSGLLPAVIIAAVAIVLNWIIARCSQRSEKFERVTQGSIATLVEDGSMNYNVMKNVRISRERLFAQLRSEQIMHLGMVQRVYMEPNGSFVLIKNEKPTPGLLVLPVLDEEFVARKVRPVEKIICKNCGTAAPGDLDPTTKTKCEKCHHSHWTHAMETI